jgi:hypothetical protein
MHHRTGRQNDKPPLKTSSLNFNENLYFVSLTRPNLSTSSKWASGAVLSQADSNGDWHPMVYLSKTFNQAK